MAPLKPHWTQPSHPEIQQVVLGKEGDFTSKSLSKINVAPLGLYAELTTPPCTFVDASTYATVQAGREKHILLNSDLLYLNHSCEPSLVSCEKTASPYMNAFASYLEFIITLSFWVFRCFKPGHTLYIYIYIYIEPQLTHAPLL